METKQLILILIEMELFGDDYETESDEGDVDPLPVHLREAAIASAAPASSSAAAPKAPSSSLTLTAINPVESAQLTSRVWLDRIDALLPPPPPPSGASSAGVKRTPIAGDDGTLDGFVLDGVLTPAECAALIALTEAVPYEDGGFSFWNRSDPDRAFRNADTIEVHHAALAEVIWRRMRSAMRDDELIVDLGSEEGGSARQSMRWQRDLEGVWEAVGTNEHVLFGRYRSGGHFAPHTDGYSIVDFNHRSMYSIVLFLSTLVSSDDADEDEDESEDAVQDEQKQPHAYLHKKDEEKRSEASAAPSPASSPPSRPANGGTRFYSDAQRGKAGLVRDDDGRWTGAARNEIGTVEAVAGRAVVFFHNHMHEGLPPWLGSTKYIIRSDVMYTRRPAVATEPRDVEAFALYCKANDLTESDLPPGARSVESEALKMLQRCFRMSPTLAAIYGM